MVLGKDKHCIIIIDLEILCNLLINLNVKGVELAGLLEFLVICFRARPFCILGNIHCHVWENYSEKSLFLIRIFKRDMCDFI